MAQRPAHKALVTPFATEPHLAPAAPAKKDPSTPPSATKPKRKAAIWADEDIIERIRAAWFHTPTLAAEREPSLSDFILQAALTRAKAREKKYNDGNPFPPLQAGKIGAGRKS
jgi:hypothetical protein